MQSWTRLILSRMYHKDITTPKPSGHTIFRAMRIEVFHVLKGADVQDLDLRHTAAFQIQPIGAPEIEMGRPGDGIAPNAGSLLYRNTLRLGWATSSPTR